METEKEFPQIFQEKIILPSYRTKQKRKRSYLSLKPPPHRTLFETWCRVSLFIRPEYLRGANRVIKDQNALHKAEAEDGDDVYYLAAANEIVFVSTDGYIRTYFKPNDGIDYFNRT